MDFHEIASVSQDQVCDFYDGVGPHAVINEKAEHANFFNHVVSVSILIYVESAHAKVRQTVPHESLKLCEFCHHVYLIFLQQKENFAIDAIVVKVERKVQQTRNVSFVLIFVSLSLVYLSFFTYAER